MSDTLRSCLAKMGRQLRSETDYGGYYFAGDDRITLDATFEGLTAGEIEAFFVEGLGFDPEAEA